MIFQGTTNPIAELLTVLEYCDHIFSGFLLTMWLYA